MALVIGKANGVKRPVLHKGRTVAYLVDHRNMSGATYRMVGDPKRHTVKSVKLAMEHIVRKLGI